MKKQGAAPPPTEAAGKPADLLAYKQCTDQLRRQRASNPYTQCKARLGLDKNEVSPVELGLSYQRLKKKEMEIPKIKAPNPTEVAPTIYPKKIKQVAYKAQINHVSKPPVAEHVKEAKRQMAMKSEDLGKPVPKGVDPDKYDSCVDDVKDEGKKVNAYAVCASSLKRNDLSPGMSYSQLKKMQTEEILKKPR